MLLIDFQRIIIEIMRNIIARNPFSGKILQQIPFSSLQQIQTQLQAAVQGFNILSKHQNKQKVSMIKELATLIELKKQEIARIITSQTGKPITQSDFQVKQALKICNYYSSHHEGLQTQNIKTQAKKKTLIKYLPLGTVYCVLPSNYPLLLNFYKTIPQLVLGNCVIVRHAHNTTGSAKVIEKLMKRVGFQSGEYQCAWHHYDQTQDILKAENVVGLNFTGSLHNGSKIAALAGRHLKKYQLQVEQNNILVVLADGNVEHALQSVLKSGYFNSGQGVTPKILVIHKSLLQNFKKELTQKLKQLKFGNPQSKDVQVGPIISPINHEILTKKRNELLKSSNLIFQRQDMKAPFFASAIFECTDKTPQILANGPLFQLFSFQQQAEIQNITKKFTNISSICLFSAGKRIQAFENQAVGNIFINGGFKFDIQVPLGGSSASGYWKQGWQESLRTFANIKTNYIN